MKKFYLLLCCVFLSACTSAGYEGSRYANVTDELVASLKSHDYEHSYSLFATPLKDAITQQQFSAYMQIITDELGSLEDYSPVVMPFIAKTDLEEKVYRTLKDEGGMKRDLYEFKFEHGTVPGKVYTQEEDGVQKILLFDVVWDRLQKDPRLAAKVKALGIW